MIPNWVAGALLACILVFACGVILFCDGNAKYLRRGRPADGGDPALRGQGCTAMLMIVVSGIVFQVLIISVKAGLFK